MVRCPRCNAENKDAANFCRKCGYEFENENEVTNSSKKIKYALIAIILILIIATSTLAITTNINHQKDRIKEDPIELANTTNTTEPVNTTNEDVNNTTEAINTTNTTELVNTTSNETEEISENLTNLTEKPSNTTRVGNLIFNIPEGYEEYFSNVTTINEDDADVTIDAYLKMYTNENEDTISFVVAELRNDYSITPDYLDAYFQEVDYEIQNRTINGKNGYYYIDDEDEPVWYGFTYIKTGMLVDISVSDENLLYELVK